MLHGYEKEASLVTKSLKDFCFKEYFKQYQYGEIIICSSQLTTWWVPCQKSLWQALLFQKQKNTNLSFLLWLIPLYNIFTFRIRWETYLSIRSPRVAVCIRQQRLFETLRKLWHNQYINVPSKRSIKEAHLLQILIIIKEDFQINACNASSPNLCCFSKHFRNKEFSGNDLQGIPFMLTHLA